MIDNKLRGFRIPDLGFGILGEKMFEENIKSLFKNIGFIVDVVSDRSIYIIHEGKLICGGPFRKEAVNYIFRNTTNDFLSLPSSYIFSYSKLSSVSKFLPGDIVTVNGLDCTITNIRCTNVINYDFEYELNGVNGFWWKYKQGTLEIV